MYKSENALSVKLPADKNTRAHWGNLNIASTALMLRDSLAQSSSSVLIICEDNHMALQFEQALRYFLENDTIPIFSIEDWETLPYDHFSPHQDIISSRLKTLSQIGQAEKSIIIVPVNTAMQRIAPKNFIQAHSLVLHCKDNLNPTQFRQSLISNGYRCVDQVMEHGEFAIRGSIIDLFPMGSNAPIRIDLFDNEIDSLRIFDIETQRSLEIIENVAILPAHEFPLTDEAIAQFRRAWRDTFTGKPTDAPIYESISNGIIPAGIEYYIPLFFEKTQTLFDYLHSDYIIMMLGKCYEQSTQFFDEVKHRYDQYSHDITRPILPVDSLYLSVEKLFERINDYANIRITSTEGKHQNFAITNIEHIDINHKLKEPLIQVSTFVQHFTGRVLFCCESLGRREAVHELLKSAGIQAKIFNAYTEFETDIANIGITVAPLYESFIITHNAALGAEQKIAYISEAQLFSNKVTFKKRSKKHAIDPNVIIRDLTELSIGQPVVHLHHGIGRYQGLTTLTIDNQINEFLTLQYAGEDKIYVPVTALDLISRYSGGDDDSAPLHRLGTDQWKNATAKAKLKVRDVAAELLAVYAKREQAKGFSFKIPENEYQKFASEFPFEETDDQLNAIDAVLKDMQSARPMDRLICGDVGFGKTEVAMRAAFIAVQNGKQVAVLVPTTLLATQHYNSFVDRFAEFAVNTDLLSRFRTSKETTAALEKLADHKIDIIIGTHKLIQPDVTFKNLGLVIIDEEHRFGVRQKEHLKKLRNEVDILSLTATPIPRTLNMSLSGMREISIINTPPARRLSVKSFLHERKNSIIREAIMREVLRGGQVFFLHNNVETIERVAQDIAELLPEAKVISAHGQMRERELETIMRDFYHQRYNVLVSTTIIETGIDIPTANTIIIDRADKFGIAQLHQLRGRVGRSHHQAYAYLLVPDKDGISADAKKRLDAFLSLTDLGVGFALASHDLEIRGSGELLGDEQSGQMHAVGFTLYMEMLHETIDVLKSGEVIQDDALPSNSEVNLHISALFPDKYIPDAQHRLILYKRLSDCKTDDEFSDLQIELHDRYGLMPDEAKHCFKIAKLKRKINSLGITKLDIHAQGGKIEFSDNPQIDPHTIIKLIQTKPKTYKLDGHNTLRFSKASNSADARFMVWEEVCNELGVIA